MRLKAFLLLTFFSIFIIPFTSFSQEEASVGIDEKINILAISTSEIKISVLVQEDLTQKAVKVLHETFELNK